MEGFIDADWASCIDDRRSYTGYAFLLAGAAILWGSKRQKTVALSSTEAEYMALSEGTKEAIYLQSFLQETGIKSSTTKLYNDNQGAGQLIKNPVFHSRTKHIDIRHHFIRKANEEKKIDPKYIGTEEMTADIQTKALPPAKHNFCVTALGISDGD